MKKGAILISSVLLIILMFAVVLKEKEPESSNSEKKSEPSSGTLVVGISGDVDSFNPLFGESSMAKEISHLMILGLADLNEKSEFKGELAEYWERSEDYLEVKYHLRNDALWSDGHPITAYDVEFTYDLLSDTSVASPNGWVTDFVKDVAVIDSYTVVFHFTKPYPDQLFDTAGEIVPKHILENVDRKSIRSHEIGRNPISSGPFELKQWISQQYIELIPNEHYFGEKPKLDRVIFKIVPDKTNLLLQLQTGEIDMLVGVEPDQVNRLKSQNPNINIYPISGRVYYYIGYNQKNPLFSDKTVRKALTMAVDRQRLIDASLQGFGKTCKGPIPPMLDWVYNDDVQELSFDPNKAKSLLEKAGWKDRDGDGWLDKNGKTFSFELKINAGNQVKSDLALVVQDQLRHIGVKVELLSLEWTNFKNKLRKKDFDAYVGGWSTSFNVDPTPIFHSSSTNLFNYESYKNLKVDKLIEIGRVEMKREKAAEIWKEMQDIIYQDQPYTFLFWIDKIVAVHSRFKNVTPIPLSIFYDLEKWYEQKEISE